jgi:hypothetical protein
MMRTFFPDYTSYPRPILLLEDIDSCVFFSHSLCFWYLLPKRGRKSKFLVIMFVVLLVLYFSFDYCFCFGHCCGLYPLIIV